MCMFACTHMQAFVQMNSKIMIMQRILISRL